MSWLDAAQSIICGLGAFACLWALVARPDLPRIVLLLLFLPLSTIASVGLIQVIGGDEYVLSQGARDALALLRLLALGAAIIWAFRS